jgi:hypothetical protein
VSIDPFPLTLGGVTLRIERLRGEAGRDAEKLAALSAELLRELREKVPEDPLLASYARVILDNYRCMAEHGIFPEVHREDDDL